MKKLKMKVEMNKHVFGLLIMCFISCQSNDTSLHDILVSNCYWDVHDVYSSANKKVAMYYKFNKDGSCLYLFTLNKNNKREEYNDDDVVAPKKWQLMGDSIMYIRGIERRIVSFSEDTLLLENPVSKERDTLIRNCK